MRTTPPATRWCHLTWSTAKHCKVFNIAALARFCERAVSEECRRLGWPGEVALLPDRIHVLVEVPGHVSRDEVMRSLRRVATEVVQGLAGNVMPRQVWEESCWCSVITNGPAVDAVRRRIRSINTPAASALP